MDCGRPAGQTSGASLVGPVNNSVRERDQAGAEAAYGLVYVSYDCTPCIGFVNILVTASVMQKRKGLGLHLCPAAWHGRGSKSRNTEQAVTGR